MEGICLKFYTHELEKHHNTLAYEWLLEFAKKHGIHGGSTFKGIAGFGRHGHMHEEHFFELASNVPVEVVFIMSESDCSRFLELLKNENIDIVYSKTIIEFGSTSK